MKASKVKL